MATAARFIKDDCISVDGVNMMLFKKGRIYIIPDDYVKTFILKGSAIEVSVEISPVEGAFLLFGTPVYPAPTPPAPTYRKGFFRRLLGGKR